MCLTSQRETLSYDKFLIMGHEQYKTEKVYIEPEDFPHLLSPDQLEEIEAYQQQAHHNGLFTQKPLPDTEDEQLRKAFDAFSTNRRTYEDRGEIDEAIDADNIVQELRPTNPKDLTPEKARCIRIRSSVVAAQKVLFRQTVDTVPEQTGQEDDRSDSYAS